MNDALKIFKLYLESTEQPTMTQNGSTKVWRLHGNLHRQGGPAVEHASGSEEWYQHGKMHREDGPAVVFSADDQESLGAPHSREYYLHGKYYDSLETWAQDVLKMHHKPHDELSVHKFLQQLLKKNVDEAL